MLARRVSSGLAGAVAALIAAAACADIPRTIHYQGRLTDTNGTPLAGEHTVTLRLYDAASEGTRLWEESHAVAFERDDRGLFAVALGSVNPFPSTFLFNHPLWLTTEVDGQGEMSPRQALTSVTSALNADRLDGLDSAELLKLVAGDGAIADTSVESSEVTDGTLVAADTAETFLTAGSGVSITRSPSTWAIAAVGTGGDITSVAAGAGLTGGATSGEAPLALAVPVAVAHGGTGATALTAGGVLLGQGNAALATTGVLGKGQLLVGDGAADPVLLSPGANGSLLLADSSQAAGVKWQPGCWPLGGADATSRSGTFQMAAFGGSDTQGRAGRLWPVPASGTVSGLRAAVSQAPGANGSWTVRLKKNGANAAPSCTIGGAATACAAAGTEAVAAGDLIGVEFTQGGNAAGTQGAGWSACLFLN